MVLHVKACILDALVTTCLVVSLMLCSISIGSPTDRPVSTIPAFVGLAPCDQLLVQVRLANIQWFQDVVREQGLKACSMIYGSTTPLQSLSELSDMGYHMVFRPLSGKQPSFHLLLQALPTHLSVHAMTCILQLSLTFDNSCKVSSLETSIKQYSSKVVIVLNILEGM